jgi:hypothetical protein
MALKKTTNTIFGIEVKDAYLRVESQKLINKSAVEFEVVCYADNQQTVSFSKSHFISPYDLNGDNPFKQAYEHIKTLPQFSDAVDC